ncbi:MAG TPA: LysR family transcriptional regulator [Polyangiaceae bacterium]|nr:LysR family transcriptional regulator [Polyangiaceae bacterium]
MSSANGVDLNDVATFVRVAQGGGFTAAAKGLGVPKSTVSRAVARLEGALGVRLVHRTTRALALTDAGRSYFERVRGAVAGLADASADVVDMGTEPRGTIRITAPVDLGQLLLADVIARFVEKYPQVHFEVSLTGRVVDLVGEGFDMAVRATPLHDSSLVVRKLGSADLGLFAARAYLRAHGTPAKVADLAEHEFIGFRPMSSSNGVPLALTGPEGAEHAEAHPSIVVDDLLFVHRLIAAGRGIGVLPLFFFTGVCASKREKDDLQRVLPQHVVRSGTLSLVAPSARQEPRRVKLFREFLLVEAKRLGFGS